MNDEKQKVTPAKVNIKAWIFIIISIAAAAFLVLVIFAKDIFGDVNNPFIQAFAQTDAEDSSSLFSQFFKSHLPQMIKTLTYIIFTFYISYGIRWLLRKYLNSGNKVTFSKLADSIVKYAAAIVIICQILTCFGVDVNALVGGAGILALVIGLGAQTLISDIISGIFFLFEGEFKVGDIVVIDGWRGTVQSIGIRSTRVIDAGGNIKIINNSSISNIVNNTSALSLAVCDVGIEYGESIERVEKVLEKALPQIKERIPAIVDGPYYKGVSELGDSCVVIKIVAKVKEEDKYQTQRDLNREVKIVFDKHNINIPFPQIVLNQPPVFETAGNTSKKAADAFVDDQKEKSKDMEEENY